MSVIVNFPNHLQLEKTQIIVKNGSMEKALEEIKRDYKENASYILDDNGKIKNNLLFVKNNQVMKLNNLESQMLESGDKIYILFQIAGG